MLTLLAYSMVIVFMALIMTKRLSALVALILVPIVFGLHRRLRRRARSDDARRHPASSRPPA